MNDCVNVKPTWSGLLRGLLAAATIAKPGGRAAAIAELQRMADIADLADLAQEAAEVVDEFLSIDDWKDEAIAPSELIARARCVKVRAIALTKGVPCSKG